MQSEFVGSDTFSGQTVVDSIYVNSQNCNYNYNVSTDSAFLDSVVPLSPPQQYIAFFHVWQQGQLIDVIDTLVFDSIGVNMVTLSMYCDTTHRSVQGTVTIVCYIKNSSGYPAAVSNVSVSANQFEIFPNPVSDITTIYVQSATVKNFNLTVTDLAGQVLERVNNVSTNHVELNLKNLAAGAYLVTLKSDEGSQSKQLMKF